MSTHCSALTLTPKSSPMWGSATLTTVASSIAIPLAATVAVSASRPRRECMTRPSVGEAASISPPAARSTGTGR